MSTLFKTMLTTFLFLSFLNSNLLAQCHPKPNFTFSENSNCCIIFTPATQFVSNWSFGDGTVILNASGQVTHCYSTPGSYNVNRVIVATNLGCTKIVDVCSSSNSTIEHIFPFGFNCADAGIRMKLFISSNQAISSVSWTLPSGSLIGPNTGNGSSINVRVPLPTDCSGSYCYFQICANITYANGEIENICEVIQVGTC